MSDILIAGSAGFTGCNLTNYMIQFSKYSVASIDNLEGQTLKGLSSSMAAKTRHQFYLMDLSNTHLLSRALAIESPKCVIYNGLAGDKVNVDSSNLASILDACLSTESVKKVIVLSKDLYDKPGMSNFIEWELNSKYLQKMEDAGKALCFVKSCDLIGQRQSPGGWIVDTILSLMNGEEVNETDDLLREWMYVRDYYIRVASLIEATVKSGTYRVFSGYQASRMDISAYLRNIILGGESVYTFKGVMPDQVIPGDKHFLPVRNMGLAHQTTLWKRC